MSSYNTNQYMFSCTLPEVIDENFLATIPRQRTLIDRLMATERIVSYALSLESSQLWLVVKATDENDAFDVMAILPLTPYMRVEISSLTFHQAVFPKPKTFAAN